MNKSAFGLLVFTGGLVLGIFYLVILPLAISISPSFAILKQAFDALLWLGFLGAGLVFLYAGLLARDTTIDNFRRSSLLQSPASPRRAAYRLLFALIGVVVIISALWLGVGLMQLK